MCLPLLRRRLRPHLAALPLRYHRTRRRQLRAQLLRVRGHGGHGRAQPDRRPPLRHRTRRHQPRRGRGRPAAGARRFRHPARGASAGRPGRHCRQGGRPQPGGVRRGRHRGVRHRRPRGRRARHRRLHPRPRFRNDPGRQRRTRRPGRGRRPPRLARRPGQRPQGRHRASDALLVRARAGRRPRIPAHRCRSGHPRTHLPGTERPSPARTDRGPSAARSAAHRSGQQFRVRRQQLRSRTDRTARAAGARPPPCRPGSGRNPGRPKDVGRPVERHSTTACHGARSPSITGLSSTFHEGGRRWHTGRS